MTRISGQLKDRIEMTDEDFLVYYSDGETVMNPLPGQD
jgi:hypothetical protein